MAQGAFIYVLGRMSRAGRMARGVGVERESRPLRWAQGGLGGTLPLLTGVEHLSSAIRSRGRLLFLRDATDNAFP